MNAPNGCVSSNELATRVTSAAVATMGMAAIKPITEPRRINPLPFGPSLAASRAGSIWDLTSLSRADPQLQLDLGDPSRDSDQALLCGELLEERRAAAGLEDRRRRHVQHLQGLEHD